VQPPYENNIPRPLAAGLLIDEGFAGKMYEDMLYDEYAQDFAKNAGFGLAELAYLELTGQRGKNISRYA
jgi:flagellar protein FlgJ